MPEVVGNAGILVDPTSPQEIGLAMVDIITADKLRIDLLNAVAQQRSKFSWKESGEKIYKELAALVIRSKLFYCKSFQVPIFKSPFRRIDYISR